MEDYKIEKKEDLEIITERFNRLNNEYNNKNEYIFNQIKNDFNNILNFNEKDVFEIINKVIKDIDIVKNNINSLYKKLDEYNGYKKACEETINNLVYFYNSHKNLLSKIPFFYVENDLSVDNNTKIKTKINLENILEKIITSIDDIETELKINLNKINNFKKFIFKCINIDKKRNYHNVCTICIDKKIDTCLNTCGHTFCSACIDKMNNKCGICRSEIKTKIKLFIEINDDENNNNINETNEDISSFEGFNLNTIFSNLNAEVDFS
jgi:hypothetical protein